MKRIMPYVGKILFALFMMAAVVFLLSLSWSALNKIFPDSVVNQIFGLAMFDVAALAWLLAFIYVAQGFNQRSISLVLFGVSLIGTISLVGLEIALSTGWLAYADIAIPLAILLMVMVAGHVTAIYLMHLFDPDVASKIERRADLDQILAQAQTDATAELDRLRPVLAREIAQGMVDEAKRELGFLPVVDGNVLSSLAAPAKTKTMDDEPAKINADVSIPKNTDGPDPDFS
jgi:apolipoprotein N-acyltransferase